MTFAICGSEGDAIKAFQAASVSVSAFIGHAFAGELDLVKKELKEFYKGFPPGVRWVGWLVATLRHS